MVERKIVGRDVAAPSTGKKLIIVLLDIDGAVTDRADKSRACFFPVKRLTRVQRQCEIEIWRCNYLKFIRLPHSIDFPGIVILSHPLRRENPLRLWRILAANNPWMHAS